jgi:uncharacterized membrane protein
MVTLLSWRYLTLVSPLMNHSSSWMMERRWSFFVVTTGKVRAEVVATLLAKDRVRARARAVLTVGAVFEHFAEQAVVFFHPPVIAGHTPDANGHTVFAQDCISRRSRRDFARDSLETMGGVRCSSDASTFER